MIKLGDCLNLMKDVPDASIDCIITDPPYNISGISQGVELHGRKIGNVEFGEWDHDFDPEPFLREAKRVLKLNGQLYIFTSDRLLGRYTYLFDKYKFHHRNTIVWFKKNLLPKMRHHSWRVGTEFILYVGAKKATSTKDYTFNWLGQDKMKNLIMTNLVAGKERLGHPNQKPLSIIKRFIEVSTNEGDIILDPFMGSGTTGKAAKELKREFIGFELSEEYFKIAEERIRTARVERRGRPKNNAILSIMKEQNVSRTQAYRLFRARKK